MGFTDRMGDVLAASDALVHSSAGLTVLEALIRGCPVVSYGFGYGHVRESNRALKKFGLAQVAANQEELAPALKKALEERPEPDTSFARRPSTASLILNDERRARQVPRWRLRTARAVTAAVALFAVAAWTLTAGASYDLVSAFVHIKAVTTVATSHPEVGVLVDAPAGQLASVAALASADGLHASFGVTGMPTDAEVGAVPIGDQLVPRLPNGGLVRWLGQRGQLHRWAREMGYGRHFLYASSGPSVGQWLFAHGAGGRLVAGQVTIDDRDDSLGPLHAGEVVEVTVTSPSEAVAVLAKLDAKLRAERLSSVSVGRLMRDAGQTV
jgi:hypothetical protein